jgi:AraC-like DNA-binding protein
LAEMGIPADSARWLVKEMVRQKIPPDRLLAGTCLAEGWLANPEATLSREQYLRIIDNALALSGNPGLGLSLGRYHNFSEYGFWGYALMSSGTLEEATQIVLPFWELTGSLVRLSYVRGKYCDTWEISPAFPMESRRAWQYSVEELLSTFLSGVCQLVNREVRFSEIEVSYPEPAYGQRYEEQFRCPVSFGRRKDLFRTSPHLRELPTSTGHPEVAAFCRRRCEEIMAKMRKSDARVDAIRKIIMSSPGRFPRLDEVAARLALSPRTLRRRLEERNTTYRKILDEVRAELSREYLLSTTLSVDQVSERIGFAETGSFRRAFRRWTGRSVSEFRRDASRTSRRGPKEAAFSSTKNA